MIRQLLSLHWKASRWGILPWVVAAFGIPFLVVGRLRAHASLDSADVWQQMVVVSPLFPLLAVAAGSTVALTAWSWDHRSGHVYALALPIARWRYAWTKFLVGLVLAAIPAAALALGSSTAAGLVELPELLRAYPVELAWRFYLATLAAYGLIFALAAGTIRTAVVVLSLGVGTILFGDGLVELAATALPALDGWRVSEALLDLASRPASPLRVFTGNWFLFDV